MNNVKKHKAVYIISLIISFLICNTFCFASDTDLVRKVTDHYATIVSSSEKLKINAVQGKEEWLFFTPELRFVSVGTFWGKAAPKVSMANKPEFADPIPAIVDFHNQLKNMGIELLMVPVPPKSVIYPDFLSDLLAISRENKPLRIDTELQAFYNVLRKEGIQILDLTSFFMENRFHRDGMLFCKQDTHWSGNGCVLAARRIYEEIMNRPWFKGIPKSTYQTTWESLTIDGDLRKYIGDRNLAREVLPVRRVGTLNAGALRSILPDIKSPVILVGDSHNLIFHAGDDMQTISAGLPDQLAIELGFPVDLAAVRGSGATPARVNLLRRAQRDPDYWRNKKLVIWCFASREFTQSDGWKKVPLTP
jgi:alginate O-acetyltransferase complex protein AlgJ